jgi:hypothetical protein
MAPGTATQQHHFTTVNKWKQSQHIMHTEVKLVCCHSPRAEHSSLKEKLWNFQTHSIIITYHGTCLYSRKLPSLWAGKHSHLLDSPREYESYTIHHHLKQQDDRRVFPHTKKDNYIKPYNIFKMLLQWFALLHNSLQWNTIMKICYKVALNWTLHPDV